MPKPTLGARLDSLEGRLEKLEAVLEGSDARTAAVLEQLEQLRALELVANEAHTAASHALDASSHVGDFDARLNQLTLAVAEGIQHVDRAEKRIQATIQRARRQLEEGGLDPSPGLEAEAAQLQLINGGARDERRVPAVREQLEDPDEVVEVPGIPGRFTRGSLKRLGG